MKLHVSLIMAAMLFLGIYSSAAEPVKLIYDTDMSGDCDDAGALAIIHVLADKGECELLGVVVNDPNAASCLCVDAINVYYNRPNIPIGVRPDTAGNGAHYPLSVADNFPHNLKSYKDAYNATELYRKILAAQPDNSVVIVSVGFLTNLAALMNSQPDNYSTLNGMDLIRTKVKMLSIMAGTFPEGREYNLHMDCKAADQVIKEYPGPIMYSGFEIGIKIMTGARLQETSIKNPVRHAYKIYLKGEGKNRHSWDLTSVIYGVRGLSGYWDACTNGYCTFNPANGQNKWKTDRDVSGILEQGYLTVKMPIDQITKEIEQLMITEPAK